MMPSTVERGTCMAKAIARPDFPSWCAFTMATRRFSPTGLPRVILASVPWQLKGTCAGSLNTFLSQGMMGILLRLAMYAESFGPFIAEGQALWTILNPSHSSDLQ